MRARSHHGPDTSRSLDDIEGSVESLHNRVQYLPDEPGSDRPSATRVAGSERGSEAAVGWEAAKGWNAKLMAAVEDYGHASWQHGFDLTVESGRARFDAYRAVLDIVFKMEG